MVIMMDPSTRKPRTPRNKALISHRIHGTGIFTYMKTININHSCHIRTYFTWIRHGQYEDWRAMFNLPPKETLRKPRTPSHFNQGCNCYVYYVKFWSFENRVLCFHGAWLKTWQGADHDGWSVHDMRRLMGWSSGGIPPVLFVGFLLFLIWFWVQVELEVISKMLIESLIIFV